MSETTTHTQQDTSRPLPKPQGGWILAVFALFFALAYGQSPLYTSNQNQYFLHGLADAGFGQLADDWLANTLDPTPVFSALVQTIYAGLGTWAFYLVYGMILVLYFASLSHILNRTSPSSPHPIAVWLRPMGLILLHAAITRWLLSRALGPDAAYLLEGGLAGQRLLGEVLQPSVFGALLLASIALFLHDRPYAAVLVSAAAASVHPTYLLSAACLTAAYLGWTLLQHADVGRALKIGLLSLAAVTPVLWLSWTVYRPTGPDFWRLASDILVEQRIPHHALPSVWFSLESVLTLAWIAIGIALARRTRLALVLIVPATVGGALSLAQIASGNHMLALLFPWRMSTWLVPLGVGLLGYRTADWVAAQLPGRRALLLNYLPQLVIGACSMLAAAGIGRTLLLAQQRAQDPAVPLFEVVRRQLAPGDQYLIPPRLQRFRLETGAPAYVDFKAIPYRDTDLLAWQERLELAQFFYRDNPSSIDCGLLPRIQADGDTTHVVLEADQFGLDCPGLSQLYANKAYALYRYQP